MEESAPLRTTVKQTLIVLVLTCLLLEAVVRVAFAIQIGPRTLLYGTEWHRNVDPTDELARQRRTSSDKEFREGITAHVEAEARDDSVEKHANIGEGYTKFFANEQKSTRDVDTGERIPVRINNQGFRGPDFSKDKAANTVRVISLGASSTFGFYNRDNETYPYHLQQQLNQNCTDNITFEVINFGIPHASSGNALSLFAAEGLPLSPDVVTFYQGRNDTTLLLQPNTIAAKIYSVLVHRLLFFAFVDQVAFGERESVTAASHNLEAREQRITDRYLDNLTQLLDVSQANEVLLVVSNQQATSAAPYPRMEQERLKIRGLTYGQEAASLRDRFESAHELDTFEYSFLVHEGMMQSLEAWTQEKQVTFVDAIDALDQDRHLLLSWVHLHPDANEVIAQALSAPILEQYCSSKP